MLLWVRRPESSEEDGASAVEYGLLLTGIAALIVAVVFLFGGAVSGLFDDTCDSLEAGSTNSIDCNRP